MKAVPFSRRQAFHGAFAVSLIINLVLMMGMFYGRHSFLSEMQVSWTKYLLFFLWHFMSNMLIVFILFMFNFSVVKSSKRASKQRLYIGVGILAICIVLSPVLSGIQWYLLGGTPGMKQSGFLLFNFLKDIFIGSVVSVITNNIYLTHKREQTILANQKLMEENIRIRYESLKNQLDPHFLFNSLNTLNGLIGVDDDKAHDYIDNLSAVFRYTLHNKDIGTLERELEYVDSYLALLRIRYGDNLQVRYDINGKYMSYDIMPASLQLLVENAVKHNVISNKAPLWIDIATTPQDSIVVSNRINPKAEKSSGGVGLANLTGRYSIISERNIVITDNDGVFSVEVPLIKNEDIN